MKINLTNGVSKELSESVSDFMNIRNHSSQWHEVNFMRLYEPVTCLCIKLLKVWRGEKIN